MMAVDDQGGRQPIFGQLIPEIIRMAAEHRVGAVAQMSAERGAGVDRGGDLRRVGRRVADGNAHAAGDHVGDEVGRAVELRRQRDETNLPVGRLGKQSRIPSTSGGRQWALRMGAARTVFGRNVRPFQMNARDQRVEFGRLLAGPADDSPGRPAASRGWRWSAWGKTA